MKNIVTIDFDVIMAPCINLYNNFVPNISWKTFYQYEQMKMLTADFVHYQKLTAWLFNTIKKINKEDIIIIEDHGQLIKYLDKNEQFNIYNIDHHHDCGYLKDSDINNLTLHCGNWGLILQQKNMLHNFYWIHNDNSDKKEIKIKYFFDFLLKDFNLNNLPVPDKLILCLSEPWIPPMFRPLFYTWLDILNEHYNTKFKIDFERCE